MAEDRPEPGSEGEETSPESRENEEEKRRRQALTLSDEIARRYSPDRLSQLVSDRAGRGEKLDLATQQEMERKIGGRFGAVRVFRGPFAEAVTRAHRADAVTVANTGMILVREGPRSDPRTALGKALIAHELTHVKQAQGGLHFALEEGQSADAPHEKEAEAVESEVHAEETGQAHARGGRGGKKPGMSREERRRRVTERVRELVEEAERVQRMRLGIE